MRAAIIITLLAGACSRPNPRFSDRAANQAIDAGADLATVDDLALAPGPDLSGPRIAFTNPCAGLNPAVHQLSATTFAFDLVIEQGVVVLDTSAPVTLSVEMADQPIVLNGAGTKNATHGHVTFDGLSIDHWGAGTLIITSPGVTSLEIPFTIRGAHRMFLTQPSDVLAAQIMQPPVQVAVFDDTGARDESVTRMSLGLAGCGRNGKVSSWTVTPQAGIATFDRIAVDATCDYQLQLNLDNYGEYFLLPPLVSNSFHVSPGPPIKLLLHGSRAMRGRVFVVSVDIVDAGGNIIPVAPTAVTLSLAGATLNGTLTQNTVNGTASFDDLSVDQLGTFTLTAHASSYPDVTSSLEVWAPWDLVGGASPANITVAIDDPKTLYGWGSDVRVSHDAGQTWAVIRSYPFVGAVIPDPTDANTIWLARDAQRSRDGGATWELLGQGSETNHLAIDATAANLYALDDTPPVAGAAPNFWISHDGAATWTAGGPALGPGDRYWDMTIDRKTGAVYVSAGHYTSGPPAGYLAKSSDGGTTWTFLPNAPLLRYLAIDPFSSTTILGVSELSSQFARSTDGGATWTSSASQSGGLVVANPSQQGHYLMAVGSVGSLLFTTNGGATWSTSYGSTAPPQTFVSSIAFAPSSPSTVYAVTTDGLLRSSNGGE